MNWGILTNLLPEIITTVEIIFSGSTGAQKQAQAIQLFTDGLALTKLPPFLQTILVSLATLLIPQLVAKYNSDPTNTVFVKP